MADKIHYATDLVIEDIERKYRGFYARKKTKIEKTIADYLKTKEKEDAKRRQLVTDGKWTETQYKRWRRGHITRGENYEAMRERIAKALAEANATATEYANSRLAKVYTMNYNAAEGATNALKGYSFELVNEDVVKSQGVFTKVLLPTFLSRKVG